MNKVFHQTIPLIALSFMSQSFKDFFLADGYTEDQLSADADLPDIVDKDNLVQNADIHHAHSYKLEIKEDGLLHWKDGDALERLKGLCADAHDFKAEQKLPMLRYAMAKMTHYRIDACTYPHLHYGKPWNLYHVKFETEMGKFIVKHKQDIKDIVPKAYDDVYKACRRIALELWHEGAEIVEQYEAGESLSDELKLKVCIICVQGVADLWATLSKELKLEG